jgi:hypothetical protein
MSEIRLRNISSEVESDAKKVAEMLKEKTITGAMEKLPGQFIKDQSAIRQLQKRNSELHKSIGVYYAKEDKIQKIIVGFLNILEDQQKNTKILINEVKRIKKEFYKKKRIEKPNSGLLF